MSERELAAWLAAAAIGGLAAALVWRGAKPVVAGDAYPRLEQAMRAATALAVGVLVGLAVMAIVSLSGG
jgi:hypothetical protein